MTSAIENQDDSYSTECITDYSQEFKIEMENSISNYFSKCNLEDNEHRINNSENLINNEVEYASPVSSLKGISYFMIDQVFSTDKIVPIEYPSDNEDTNIKNEKENKNKDSNNNDNSDTNKMSSCNSDVTLNVNNINATNGEDVNATDNEDASSTNNDNENDIDDENISKSFAVEFIDLLDINMKELNSKKDDFHVIGLKKADESNRQTSIKFKDDVIERSTKPKPKSKLSKHISLLKLDRKSSSRLSHSKSVNTKSSQKTDKNNNNVCKLKKSKSKLGLSKIFKNVKKRMSTHE